MMRGAEGMTDRPMWYATRQSQVQEKSGLLQMLSMT
jgi:hypothetical protein